MNVIVPATARGADGFYDPSGMLRPDVQRLYRYDLQSLDRLVGRTEKNAADVVAVLARDTI